MCELCLPGLPGKLPVCLAAGQGTLCPKSLQDRTSAAQAQTPLQHNNPKHQDVSLQKFPLADTPATTLSSAWRPWKSRSGQTDALTWLVRPWVLQPHHPYPQLRHVQLPHDWKGQNPHPRQQEQSPHSLQIPHLGLTQHCSTEGVQDSLARTRELQDLCGFQQG